MIRPLKFAAATLALSLALSGCSGAEQAEAPADETAAESAAVVETVAPAELASMVEGGGALLVDVREPDEFAAGHLAGAINMPLSSFDPAAVPMEPGRETILYCRSSRRSGQAAQMMADHMGGTVRHLEGGMMAWEEAGLDTVTEPSGD